MTRKRVSALSLLAICVCLFGTANFANGQSSDDTAESSINEETKYDSGDNVVDENGPVGPDPVSLYDGVQMTKDIAELKDLVASLKGQVTQTVGDLAGTNSNFDSLSKKYNTLIDQYNDNKNNYETLAGDFKTLKLQYDDLNKNYDTLLTNFKIMSEHLEDDVAVVSETAQKNFENLQAQISAVVISEGDLKNKLLGPDTIITIFTQPDGPKTTTIKTALSDLYNTTFSDNIVLTNLQQQVSKIPSIQNSIDDLTSSFKTQSITLEQHKIQLDDKDVQLKKAVDSLRDDIGGFSLVITNNNATISKQIDAVTTKQQSDVTSLQAQINSLMQLENKLSNTMIGPDTIITIYTQTDGVKTTTVKNALSDLYNISTSENNLITKIQQQITAIDLNPILKKIDDVSTTVNNKVTDSIDAINKSISSNIDDLAKTESADVKKLQEQIDLLRQLENDLEKRPFMGPDTVITIYTMDGPMMTTVSYALSSLYNGSSLTESNISSLKQQIYTLIGIDLISLQEGIDNINDVLRDKQNSFDALNKTIADTATSLHLTEKSDIMNLQAQIDVLRRQNETDLAQKVEIGPDTIITIHTELGEKTTTIKNALSDLYNITVSDSNLMTSLKSKVDRNVTSMQQDIADLNNILTKHQQSIDALSNDLTDHMNATKKLITEIKDGLSNDVANVLATEKTDVKTLQDQISTLNTLVSNFGDNNITINGQMTITVSKAVSELYSITRKENDLITTILSSLTSTSGIMQGRIDDLNSQLKKLKEEMNSTIFNQKPVTDTVAVTSIVNNVFSSLLLPPIQFRFDAIIATVNDHSNAISTIKQDITNNVADLTTNFASNLTNLQAQINLLNGIDQNIEKKQVKTDEIISLLTEDGKKMTTIQNSLSDLYNRSSKQFDAISQLQTNMDDVAITAMPQLQRSIADLQNTASNQKIKIDEMDAKIAENAKNFTQQIQDLTNVEAMNSNTLKSQIETLKKQQGGMSQDLSQIGSSVTIAVTSVSGEIKVTTINNALSDLGLSSQALNQHLSDLQTKLTKANVYDIDRNINDLSNSLNKQEALISGMSLNVYNTINDIQLKILQVNNQLGDQLAQIRDLNNTCGSCNVPKTDADNVTAIAKSVVSLALDTFQKSQIQPIQQLTSTQLIALNNTVTALLPPMQVPKFVPSNCRDLKKMGNKVNGIFPVFNNSTKSVDMTFCDFSASNVLASKIGTVNVKQSMVNFYVQRNKTMSCCGVVDWQVMQVNQANGFDMKTGIFTAPLPGYYMFNFASTGNAVQKNRVKLQKNNGTIGNAWSQSAYDTMTMSANLYLAKGDQVSIYLSEGGLYDNSNRLSHFTGSLIDQAPITITV